MPVSDRRYADREGGLTVTSPIACALTPDQLRDRKAGLLPGLCSRAATITPRDEGLQLEFAADDRDIVSTIAAVIDAERRCCPFLSFAVTVAPDAGPIVLSVSGPAGTRAFLESLLPVQAPDLTDSV
jgi:hypothetical protein